MILINIFLVLFGLTLIENVAAQTAKCTGPGWTVYKDTQKCIKLIEKRVIRKEALAICKQEESNIAQSFSATSSHPPQLLTIDSQTQQDFLNEYLFTKNKLKSNVWIGAKRFTPNMGADYFIWENGSKVDYSSWAQGYPTSVSERPCVAMAIDAGGNWKDFICDMEYFVVCQRDMHDNEKPWSLEKLTEEFLETRKKLTDALDKADNKIKMLEKDAQESDKTIKGLKTDVEKSDKTIKELKTDVEKSDKTIKELKTDVEKSDKTIKELKTDVEKSDKTIKELKTDVEKSDKTIKELKTNVEKSDKTIKELKTDVEKSDKTIKELKTDVEKSDKTIKELKTDVEKSDKTIKELKTEVGNTQTNLTTK